MIIKIIDFILHDNQRQAGHILGDRRDTH